MDKKRLRNYSYLTYLYMQQYIKFEEVIKKGFIDVFDTLDVEVINRIAYLQGAKDITSIQTQFTDGIIKSSNAKYKKKSMLNTLSVANIIAINRSKIHVDKFNFSIKNFERREDIAFIYICEALLRMRNRIAHMNFQNSGFEKRELVGNLSKRYILDNNFDDFDELDLKAIECIEIGLISNYLYMKKLITIIEETENE